MILRLVIPPSLYGSPTWYNNRVLTPNTTPTSTQQPLCWKMSHHILKSDPRCQTPTIRQCLHLLCELGLSASFGLSLYPVSINFSPSGTLPCRSVLYVFRHRSNTYSPVLSCTLLRADHTLAFERSHRRSLGTLPSQSHNLWNGPQPGSFHHQRTRHHHDHGFGRIWICLRCEYQIFSANLDILILP